MRKKKGFTLIETVMAITILSIIAGMGLFSMVKFYELWNFSSSRLNVLWGSRYLMRDVAFNLRMVRDTQSVYSASATRFRFFNLGTGAVTDYQFIDGKLYKNGTQILPEITAFAFTYYDANGNTIAVPLVNPNNTNIRAVRVDFSLTSGGESVALRSTVKCRNLFY